MQKLISQLEKYTPFNEQEERDKGIILNLLKTQPDIFERSNLIAHMTASAWVVNKDRSKILLAYHNIYDSWAWLGGHADGEKDLLKVALKEVGEESGVKNIRPVSEDILSVEILTVDGHKKKGIYVPSHLHLNVTYLIEADDTEQPHICVGENSNVAWFDKDKAVKMSNEKWFKERIYSKLMKKVYPGNL